MKRFIDLSHFINQSINVYPGDPEFKLIKKKSIEFDNCLVHEIKMGSHLGTHIDFPSHIFKKAKFIQHYDINSFIGNSIKVNYDEINLEKLQDLNFEFLILNYNWYQLFPNNDFYTKKRPSIDMDLLNLLIDKKIKGFCTDLPTVDVNGSKTKDVHKALLGNDILIYESLNNLNMLTSYKIYAFQGLPLNINFLEASPSRPYVIDNENI